MEYKLSRYEKNRDKNGKVVSIFVAVSISEGTNTLNQEHWLTQDEVSSVLTDETKLEDILSSVAKEGEDRLRGMIANKPLDPIVADSEKLKSFKIKVKEKKDA